LVCRYTKCLEEEEEEEEEEASLSIERATTHTRPYSVPVTCNVWSEYIVWSYWFASRIMFKDPFKLIHCCKRLPEN
jgi:hypothetical protein